MQRENRHPLVIKIHAVQRLAMLHTLSGRLPLYLVMEYPRSGGSWFGEMLSDYLEVPFPRNKRPPLETCIMHGHHLYHPNFENAVSVVRDGRDAIVSEYFKRLFVNPPHAKKRDRDNLQFDDYDDVVGNLPRFIEYVFTEASRGFFHFNWAEYIRSWSQSGSPFIHYERLLVDAPGELAKAIRHLTGETPDMERLEEIAEHYKFENVAKRKRGEENKSSTVRKGIAGDWKNKFSRVACEVFDYYAGDELIELGYEDDRSWIRTNWAMENAEQS
jgi:hypothetical protein